MAPAPEAVRSRPPRARYILVVLLPVTALVAAGFWLYAAERAVSATADAFARGFVPGQVTLSGHPDTWFVYATGATTAADVQVTGPDGRAIPVSASAAGTYRSGGREFRAVGRFNVEPGEIGDLRVAVAGTPGDEYFAVGNFDVNGFMRPQLWTMGVLLIVNIGSAVAVAVAPAVRRRRPRGTCSQSDPS